MTYVLLDFPNEILSIICLCLKEDKLALVHLSSTCKQFRCLIGTSNALWSDLFTNSKGDDDDDDDDDYLTEMAAAYERASGYEIDCKLTVFTHLSQLSEIPLLRYAIKSWLLPNLNERIWNTILGLVLLMDTPDLETFNLVLMKDEKLVPYPLKTIDRYIDVFMIAESNRDVLISRFEPLMHMVLRDSRPRKLVTAFNDHITMKMSNTHLHLDYAAIYARLVNHVGSVDSLDLCINEQNGHVKKLIIFQILTSMLDNRRIDL